MAGNKSRWIILTLIPILIAAVTAYYFYNKGPVDVSSAKAEMVDAKELYNAYLTDTASAGKKYSEKILEVSGTIKGTTKTAQDETVILLDGGSEGANVNCTLQEKAENIPSSGQITIRGVCSGMGQGDPDLGIMGDVYLSRCILLTTQ